MNKISKILLIIIISLNIFNLDLCFGNALTDIFKSDEQIAAEKKEEAALSEAKSTITKNIEENAKLKEELKYKGYGPGDSSYDTAVAVQGALENTLTRINEGEVTSAEAAEAISDFNKESKIYGEVTPRAIISQTDAESLKSGESGIAQKIMDKAEQKRTTLQEEVKKTQGEIDKKSSELSTLQETAANDDKKLKELEASGIATTDEITEARTKAAASKKALEEKKKTLQDNIDSLTEKNQETKKQLSMIEQRIEVTEETIKTKTPEQWKEMKNTQAEIASNAIFNTKKAKIEKKAEDDIKELDQQLKDKKITKEQYDVEKAKIEKKKEEDITKAKAEKDTTLAKAKEQNEIESLKQQLENAIANGASKEKIESLRQTLNGKIKARAKAQKDACDHSENCLTESSFMLNTGNTFGLGKVGGKSGSGTASAGVNSLLGTVIQKLMIMLGSLSLLIMTVGAGYMILFHGQDEYLSKGKGIFTAGITSLIIALSSYLLVSLIRFILYSTTGS